MRFHIVGLPHTEVTKEFLPCAYTQKIFNFAKMMKSLGHEVFLYGGGDKTETPCDEFISIISSIDQQKYFGHTDWKKDFFPIKWTTDQPYWIQANTNAITEIRKRLKPKDFICVIAGTCQLPIAQAFPGTMTVEFGIGYGGTFSEYRVFESYAHMHYIYGKQNTENGKFYDAVIPNYFDPDDFPFSAKKKDYYLFIGRMVSRKGPHLAVDITGHIGAKLKMAGQGVLKKQGNKIISQEITVSGDHIEHVGVVGVKERGELMKNAKAIFVPTLYLEPFGGVSIEAMMCGTPVIATDFGAFPENIIDGVTGYRIRTLGEGIWAAQNVDKLDPHTIREYAVKNFALDRVRWQYQSYFEQLMELWDKGWASTSYIDRRRYQKYI